MIIPNNKTTFTLPPREIYELLSECSIQGLEISPNINEWWGKENVLINKEIKDSQRKMYSIINSNNGNCVLCGSKISSCSMGEYCSNLDCTYCDGYARLTEEEAKKFKDKIMK
jgi:hypothetical protein